jgi:hypothetical protein
LDLGSQTAVSGVDSDVKWEGAGMWLIGAIILIVFYRFAFRWYFHLFSNVDPIQRPILWHSKGFHVAVLLIAGLLLVAAGFFLYLSNPWLVIVAVIFVPAAWAFYGISSGNRMVSIIWKAVRLQVTMQRQGIPQPEINRHIANRTIKDKHPVRVELPFEDFLKFCILSPQGFIPYDYDQVMTTMKQIDEEIMKAREKMERVNHLT